MWDEFARARLPLCVQLGMSYPPLAELGRSIYDGHIIGMSLPAQLAFMAIVGHRMLDRYPDLKVAFLEFGAEWIFSHGRQDGPLPASRSGRPLLGHEHAQRGNPAAKKRGRIREVWENFYRRGGR